MFIIILFIAFYWNPDVKPETLGAKHRKQHADVGSFSGIDLQKYWRFCWTYMTQTFHGKLTNIKTSKITCCDVSVQKNSPTVWRCEEIFPLGDVLISKPGDTRGAFQCSDFLQPLHQAYLSGDICVESGYEVQFSEFWRFPGDFCFYMFLHLFDSFWGTDVFQNRHVVFGHSYSYTWIGFRGTPFLHIFTITNKGFIPKPKTQARHFFGERRWAIGGFFKMLNQPWNENYNGQNPTFSTNPTNLWFRALANGKRMIYQIGPEKRVEGSPPRSAHCRKVGGRHSEGRRNGCLVVQLPVRELIGRPPVDVRTFGRSLTCCSVKIIYKSMLSQPGLWPYPTRTVAI